MSRPRAFVEAPAGLASVSLRLHGGAHCRPPISRMGNKAGYAHVILAALGLRSGEGAGAYVWAESDPDVRALLRAYPDPDMLRRIADIIRGWKDEEPRALWERLRAERKARGPIVGDDTPAGWIVSEAWGSTGQWCGPDRGGACGSHPPGWVGSITIDGLTDRCHRLAEYASIAASNRLIHVAGPELRNTGAGGTTFGGEAFATPAAEVASGFERVAGWLTAGSLTHGGLDVRGPQRWSFNTGFESGETFARGPEGVAEDCHRLAEYASNEVASGFERVAGWTYLGATGFVGGDADSAYAGDPGDGPGFSGRAGDPRLRIGGRLDAIASRWPPVAVLPTLPDAATLSALLGTPGDLDGVVVYMDPPYVGTTGYADDLPRADVVRFALDYHRAGAVVCVSEAVPVDELVAVGWHAADIAAGRRGQKRTFSATQGEVLTMSVEPKYRVATQVSMFGRAV